MEQQAQAPATTQTQAVEGVQTESTPKISDEALSPKFAALARQQKAFLRQQQELKAKEEALKAKEKEYETNYIPRSKIKENPFSVLTEDLGISYDEIVKAAMSQDPQAQAIKMIDNKLKSVEQKLEESQKAAIDAQQKQYEQAVEKIRQDVIRLVSTDETYEAIKAEGAQEAVVTLIEDTFKENGTILSVEEASKQVEEYIIEKAMKLASLGKVKNKMTPPTPEPTVNAQAAPKQAAPIKTLTTSVTNAPNKVMTAKERRERAIAAFRGQVIG